MRQFHKKTPTWPQVVLYRPILRAEDVGTNPQRAAILFLSEIESTRRVKTGHRTASGKESQRPAFTPAVILVISLPETESKTDPG